MTDEEKAKRRTRIEDAAQQRSTGREMSYWITRDSDEEGNLENTVDVWLVKPYRERWGSGAKWFCTPHGLRVQTATGDVPARYATWTKDQCYRACRVLPDTDRECIRVG